jgi:apolipoprotein N-acyltransferase
VQQLIRNKFATTIIYAICGILCALPAIFNALWLLSWIAYTPVLLNEMKRNDDSTKPYKSAWLRGLAFFYPYGLTSFYWLWELYPMDFIGLTPTSALFVITLAWLGLPLLQGSASALSISVLCLLKKKKMPNSLYPITAALIWVIFEWIHTLTWAGVPWGKLAIGQVGMLFNVQSASLFGAYFVSFVIICASGYLALALKHLKNKETKMRGILCVFCAISIFAFNFLYGAIAMYGDRAYLGEVTVGIVQGNVPSAEKWDNNKMEMLSVHQELANKAANDGAELIVFAETAFPYIVNNDEYLTDYIESISKNANADMIVGCLHADESGNLYNSTRYVSQKSGFTNSVYNKRRLVPFGEYLPMRNIFKAVLPILDNINMLSIDLSAGTSPAVFKTEYGGIGSLICFDSIYEHLALETVRDGAQVLAISTNDCWFQDSPAVYQHNAHAILRSIETGRYTIRSANTGISTIITDRGEVTRSLDPLTKGYVVGDVKFADYQTAYTTVGNIIVIVAFVWLFMLNCMLSIKAKKGSKLSQAARVAQQFNKQKKKNGKK